MAIEKFIIDKSDLSALLKGEELAIHPIGNIRGICVEIAGNVTNGDMVKAMFGEPTDVGREGFIYKCQPCDGKFLSTIYLDFDWWNAPYNVRGR